MNIIGTAADKRDRANWQERTQAKELLILELGDAAFWHTIPESSATSAAWRQAFGRYIEERDAG